jgi:pimeloyl-ACP methyl ester carboxylesterase
MKSHTARGAAGVKLHVREWGDPSGTPIVFVHGWSQSHLCWARQVESELADEFRLIAFDLRGHGMSDAPREPEAYAGDAWALDVAAVLEVLSLERPILVGWSYGGYVICDYLRKFGDRELAGIDFVAAGVVLGPKAFGALIGPGFLEYAPDCCAPDLATNVAAARSFLRTCLPAATAEDFESSLAAMMVVRPDVRAALISRELDFTSVLEALAVPVLVSHSRAETVVLPAMGQLILDRCPTARASWYEGAGHAPFLEAPDRFNAELAAFAREVGVRPR